MDGDTTSPRGEGPRGSGGLASRRKGPSLKTGFTNLPEREVTREQIVAHTLKKCTTINVNGKTVDVDPSDIEVVRQLGKGAYGIVEQVRHRPSNIEMAVKRTAISQEQKRFLMDMDVLVKAVDCPQIVKFYGALFWEGDLWIFMEIMDSSLDKFYRRAYEKARSATATATETTITTTTTTSTVTTTATESQSSSASFNRPAEFNSTSIALSPSASNSPTVAIPESTLGKIAYCVVKALHYLHGISIIHRDVKPSNILINRVGEVKLCDFGISGPLINSVAKTIEVGCKPYMAPERINPPQNRPGYDIRSDVWSLGITMLEMAIGQFPYSSTGNNFFNLLKKVCTDEPPKLPPNRYSPDCEDFICKCLQKDYQNRPYYASLLEHPFLTTHQDADISDFVVQILT